MSNDYTVVHVTENLQREAITQVNYTMVHVPENLQREAITQVNYTMVHVPENLQREAITLVKQYGYFMPTAVKSFLKKLAYSLNWQDLIKEL